MGFKLHRTNLIVQRFEKEVVLRGVLGAFLSRFVGRLDPFGSFCELIFKVLENIILFLRCGLVYVVLAKETFKVDLVLIIRSHISIKFQRSQFVH